MAAGSEHDHHVRYLLGELSESENEAFEEDYFGSDERYGRLLMSQDGLVEQYLAGQLPPERRVRFEGRYLSTEAGRRVIDIERLLRRRAASRTATRPMPAQPPVGPARRWNRPAWLAAAAVVLVAIAVGFRGRTPAADGERDSLRRAVRDQEERVRAQERQLGDLKREIERLRAMASMSEELLGADAGRLGIATLSLASSGRRSAETLPTLRLARDATLVRMTLSLSASTRAPLQASLQTPEGQRLWSRSGLRAQAAAQGGAEVTFAVPAAVLSPGHYVITLAEESADPAAPSLADYVFRVAAGN